MQDIGNELRRENGLDYLALATLGRADKEWRSGQQPDERRAIILDGIKNLGELETLKQFPNFFSVSLQADREVRQKRMLDQGRFRDEQ